LQDGYRSRSLRLKPEIAGARYLLLHSDGAKAVPGLLRISSKGPRVISKDALKKKGIRANSHDNYLIFDVEPASELKFSSGTSIKLRVETKVVSQLSLRSNLDALLGARKMEK